MKQGATRNAVRREDYAPYPWLIESFSTVFEVAREITTVKAELRLRRPPAATSDAPIELDGQNIELVSVVLDGRRLQPGEYTVDADHLVIPSAPAVCTLTTEVRLRPEDNLALEGLYPSGDFLLTQCEAEGFRKITYFPDRPDVMTRYDVTVIADRKKYPVLLSNGNVIESGELHGGRHWVRWVDPFRKPCYLFALVAGDLEYIEDHFTTRSGRRVVLRVYVEKKNLGKCGHAMTSLIKAMQWDEQRFDLEYDLDIYNIVATDDFNMGAMENKSLNIFNSKYILARPETATDQDFQAIEAVIGHEYFHNWTGNRVTCRDWFQLTLKEGLTVFRDQEFSSDMQSRAVKRIRDVRDLRSAQFPEDSGPMSHPIRPDHYVEINNFYTMTVYQKGAAIIRMVHALVGEKGFQKGIKLYFQRHDGQAVTCDDFLAAMADANGHDLQRFSRWYGQSGTPVVTACCEHDAAARRFTLHLSQATPATHDQPLKQALVIPFALGLLTRQGDEIPLQLQGEKPGECAGDSHTRVLLLENARQTFVFENVPEPPVPSLLRDFSAPVKLQYDCPAADLALLIQHDPDAFVRWESAQLLAQQAILAVRQSLAEGRQLQLDPQLLKAFDALLRDRASDPALLAETLMLPGEDYLAEQMTVIDVDGLHAARKFVKQALATALCDGFRARYDENDVAQAYDLTAASVGRRSLKNVCLAYLAELPGEMGLVQRQFERSSNMTDSLASLSALVYNDAPCADAALEHFEQRWRQDALVMDKWFSLQARQPLGRTVERLQKLIHHPAFSLTNPNKVRSVVGAFAMSNPSGFHVASGAGYRWVADRVLDLDPLNPQVAARTVCAFNHWRRYDPNRQALMKAELERIDRAAGLSPGVAEIVGKALN